jgi:hypothetical protein
LDFQSWSKVYSLGMCCKINNKNKTKQVNSLSW